MENSDSKELEQNVQPEEAPAEEAAEAEIVDEQPDADEKLAKELGVEYLDLNLMRRQIPINWRLETKDKGDHLNYSGATKVSVFLAKYLQKTELFKDKRNDGAYSQWHDAVKQFNESIKKG